MAASVFGIHRRQTRRTATVNTIASAIQVQYKCNTICYSMHSLKSAIQYMLFNAQFKGTEQTALLPSIQYPVYVQSTVAMQCNTISCASWTVEMQCSQYNIRISCVYSKHNCNAMQCNMLCNAQLVAMNAVNTISGYPVHVQSSVAMHCYSEYNILCNTQFNCFCIERGAPVPEIEIDR